MCSLIRGVALLLALLLAGLQWRLWYSDSSLPEVWNKQARVAELVATQESLTERNRRLFAEVDDLKTGLGTQESLTERNRRLFAEVDDLKTGLGAVEARARLDLGLIGLNETFYQVIDDAPSHPISAEPLSSALNLHAAGADNADAPADIKPNSSKP